jgi:hypothetical protein
MVFRSRPPNPNARFRQICTVNRLSARTRRMNLGIDGRSLGNGTAFSAVAPSQQPDGAHRSNIREWYCPQARIAGHSTSQLIVGSSPHRGFLLARLHWATSVARLLHTAR